MLRPDGLLVLDRRRSAGRSWRERRGAARRGSRCRRWCSASGSARCGSSSGRRCPVPWRPSRRSDRAASGARSAPTSRFGCCAHHASDSRFHGPAHPQPGFTTFLAARTAAGLDRCCHSGATGWAARGLAGDRADRVPPDAAAVLSTGTLVPPAGAARARRRAGARDRRPRPGRGGDRWWRASVDSPAGRSVAVACVARDRGARDGACRWRDRDSAAACVASDAGERAYIADRAVARPRDAAGRHVGYSRSGSSAITRGDRSSIRSASSRQAPLPPSRRRDFLHAYRTHRPDYILHSRCFFPARLGHLDRAAWFAGLPSRSRRWPSGRGGAHHRLAAVRPRRPRRNHHRVAGTAIGTPSAGGSSIRRMSPTITRKLTTASSACAPT